MTWNNQQWMSRILSSMGLLGLLYYTITPPNTEFSSFQSLRFSTKQQKQQQIQIMSTDNNNGTYVFQLIVHNNNDAKRMKERKEKENLHPSPSYNYANTIPSPVNDTVLLIPSQQQSPRSHCTQEENSTIVFILGNLRGGEETWSSMYEHLLDVNCADLGLIIGKQQSNNTTSRSSSSSSLYQRAKIILEFPEYDEWADAIDLLNTNWRTNFLPLVRQPCATALGPALGMPGTSLINFMARYWLQQHLVTEKKKTLLETYSRFVVTRSDFYYACHHDLSELDPTKVWVPHGEDYYGICDRHVVASRDDILDVLNVLPLLLNETDLYPTTDRAFPCLNPERALKWTWQANGIWSKVRRLDRMMFLVRRKDYDPVRSGQEDQGMALLLSQQSNMNNDDDDDLIIKYEYEYYGSQCTCEQNQSYTFQQLDHGRQSGYCGNTTVKNV